LGVGTLILKERWDEANEGMTRLGGGFWGADHPADIERVIIAARRASFIADRRHAKSNGDD